MSIINSCFEYRNQLFACLLPMLMVIGVATILPAQQNFCETETGDRYQRHFDQLVREHTGRVLRRANTLIDVPVVFHIEVENGTPVYSEVNLLNKLALVNTYFIGGNIQFTNCAPIVYYTGTGSERVNNILNVYLYSGSSGCGVYTGSSISINVSCNRTFEHILAHELGHALGLPHTHGFTNTGTTTELVDGSNCLTDGDRFCDTPADPNLLGKVNGSCVYTGTATDANGQNYMPDETNIMSYTRSSCADKFSTEQLTRMYQVAQSLAYECCRIDPPMVADTSICSGMSVTLSASTDLADGLIKWYTQGQGGNPIATGTSFTTGPLISSTAYYLEVQDSCTSERTRLLVTVDPEDGLQLLKTNLFADLDTSSQGSYPSFFLGVADTALIFVANGDQLYYTSVSMDTALLLTDTFDTEPNTNISGIELLEQQIIVAVNNFNTGPALWKINLSNFEASLLYAFGLNYGYSNFWLTKVDDEIFAQLNNETGAPGNGVAEIWKTDGHLVGTTLVKQLSQTNPFVDFQFTAFSGNLVFIAEDSLHGEELWISDGSTTNTQLLKDIYPGANGAQISDLTLADGLIYFAANDSTHGKELWISDGTSAGTDLLVDVIPGVMGSNPYGIKPVNGNLYFSADNGIDGSEPYKSDGTPEGTQQIANLNLNGGSSPSAFTFFDDAVYFSANQGVFDYELFKEDISTGVVSLVENINPTGASVPSNFYVHDGLILFTANDGQHGTELWQSDGTANGTHIVKDIAVGPGSSYPSNFYGLGPRLFFTANDGNGTELWVLDIPEFEVCYGESITLETSNSGQMINWYDAPFSGQLLDTGFSLMVEDIRQNKIIYATITANGCTSTSYEVPILIKSDCPCVGPENLLLDQTYTQIDRFSIHGIRDISSSSIFLSGSDMIYQAPNSILLTSGLEVEVGSQFQVQIAPCQDP